LQDILMYPDEFSLSFIKLGIFELFGFIKLSSFKTEIRKNYLLLLYVTKLKYYLTKVLD